MNIVLTGSWNALNKGDAGMITTLIQNISKKYTADITIISYNPDIDEKIYGRKCVDSPIKPFIHLFPGKNSKLYSFINDKTGKVLYIIYALWKIIVLYVCAKLKIKGTAARALLGRSYPSYRALLEADAVMGVPGGYFTGSINTNLNAFLYHGIQLLIPSWAEKNVGLTPASIGPYKKNLIGWAAEKVFNRMDFILLREPKSETFLQAMQVNRPLVKTTTDYAFQLEAVAPGESKKELERLFGGRNIDDMRPLIGMTAHGWSFPEYNWKEIRDKRDRYYATLATLCETAIERLNGKVVFLPQNMEEEPNRNVPRTAKRICERIPEHCSRIIVLDRDFTPQQLKGLYGLMDACIVSHMHGFIFSTSQLRPTLGIAYEPKFFGMAALLGIEDQVLDMYNLDPQHAETSFLSMYARRQGIHEHLDGKMKEIEALGRESNEVIEDFLSGSVQ